MWTRFEVFQRFLRPSAGSVTHSANFENTQYNNFLGSRITKDNVNVNIDNIDNVNVDSIESPVNGFDELVKLTITNGHWLTRSLAHTGIVREGYGQLYGSENSKIIHLKYADTFPIFPINSKIYKNNESYISFGSWLDINGSIDEDSVSILDCPGIYNCSIGLFASGSDPYTQDNIRPLTGSVTYDSKVRLHHIPSIESESILQYFWYDDMYSSISPSTHFPKETLGNLAVV